MPKSLEGVLIVLGLVLLGLMISIIGAAVRESVVEPGSQPPLQRRWWARGIMVSATVLLAVLLWGGKHWWEAEAADYRNNRLYRPVETRAGVVVENGERILRLEIPSFDRAAPLVPDHGKLMHLFLVREPDSSAFAHLHPLKRDKKTFEVTLPDLPAGSYQLYADITYETGFSDTLTNRVEVREQGGQARREGFDPDDAWSVEARGEMTDRECRISQDCVMLWIAPTQLGANKPLELRFTVRDGNGRPVTLEPYLGMRGHLALRRQDGTVFTHLHPGGSASMAAMQLSTLRTEGKLPLKAAFGEDDPVCKLPAMTSGEQEWLRGIGAADNSTVSFPYAFPKPGRYRLWVQVKVNDRVLTGIYDLNISDRSARL